MAHKKSLLVRPLLVSLQIAAAVGPACTFVLLSSYAALSRQYELGAVYSYNYETSVLLNEPRAFPVSTMKNVGFKLELDVDVSPVWQNPSSGSEQILELKIGSPKLSVKSRQGPSPEGFLNKASKADYFHDFPFFIHRKGGLIESVFHNNQDSVTWLNIKKGIASLFQYQPREFVSKETDSSGDCEVSYRMKGHQFIHKVKGDCLPQSEYYQTFNHSDKVLSAQVQSEREITFELQPDEGSIKSSSSVEIHTLRPEARRSSGVEVISKQVLRLKEKAATERKTFSASTSSEVLKVIAKEIRNSLVSDTLQTKPDEKECIACKSLSDLVLNFQKALSPPSVGSQSSTIAFIRLLGKIRESDEKTIKAALKDRKNAKILPQLLDIVAAAQTLPAHNAAKSVISYNSGKIDLAERYLLGLSVATHPLEYIIEDLLKVYRKGPNDARLAESLILSIAAMSKTFASNPVNTNRSVISAVESLLMTELDNCKVDDCKLRYIRALKNLQSKTTLPTLIKYARSDSRKPAIYAMRAIQTMPSHYIDEKISRSLEMILFELDALHDSSVRAMAAEVLLRWKPDFDILKDILSLLQTHSPRTKELHTIILGHIIDLCEKNQEMNEMVENALSQSGLRNYHALSQAGLSSAFSRPLITEASVNASFNNMLEINGGILKRSNVDVYVDVGDSRMRLLSFGMFAGGLSMFGGDEASDDENEEANAGIEISILGTQLRPFVFFTGQGELMGHVWSGTASDRTTALQGSILLQDHSQSVPLQNGLNVELLLTGAVSYDFAGQIQVSLWNRNAHSLVEVGAAAVVQGQARVDNAFVQTMVEFNVGAQTQLDFVSDLDFSDEIMMCLRMMQPDFDVIDNVRKFERIPGTNYVLRKYKRKSSTIPGKTYVMNKKNTELCNKMFRDS